MSEILEELKHIFIEYCDKRICVVGTTCCGKSTLQKHFKEAEDMDELLWPTLSKEEKTYICSKPWTPEIGSFTNRIVKERIEIKPGHPLFSLITLETDILVYLDISDEKLKAHCEKRMASFEDAKKVKIAIENTVSRIKEEKCVKVLVLEI